MGYSQGYEDEKIIEYFNGEIGTCLSIGENDGECFSNVRQLILDGWKALLVEPAPSAYRKLGMLYHGNDNIMLMNVAVGDKYGLVKFFESGSHLNKGDVALLSTAVEEEVQKWASATKYNETNVWMVTLKTLLEHSPYREFDFINIDTEGYDLTILKQMDLGKLRCRAICVEHNSNRAVLNKIRHHCEWYGLKKELLVNHENIILAR